jgi:transmembrane sensor
MRREAATWLARLQSGRDSDAEHGFRKWLESDPRHSEAFERISRTYDRAGLLRYSQSIDSVRAPRARESKGQLRPALAALATVALLVPVGLLLIRFAGVPFAGTETVILMTGVGEIRPVELADGSQVTLDTATKVEVDVGRSHRSARLLRGRARFEVARASVPFEVETASGAVATSNGVVDVEQIGRSGRVEVLEGKAEVRLAGPPQARQFALGPGQGMSLDPSGARGGITAAQGPDWTRGMLQFDATPLPQAVRRANRYSERQIVLLGDLRGLRVTGAFRAGDTIGLSKALAAAFNLSLRQAPNGDLVLSAGAPSDRRKKKGG